MGILAHGSGKGDALNDDCKLHESALVKWEQIKHQTRQTEDTDWLAEPGIVNTANGRRMLVFCPAPYNGDTRTRKKDYERKFPTPELLANGKPRTFGGDYLFLSINRSSCSIRTQSST